MHFPNAAQHACPARPASLHGSRLRSSTFVRRLQLFSTATSCCSIRSHTGESGVLTCSVQRQQQWRPWRGAAAACVRAASRVPWPVAAGQHEGKQRVSMRSAAASWVPSKQLRCSALFTTHDLSPREATCSIDSAAAWPILAVSLLIPCITAAH